MYRAKKGDTLPLHLHEKRHAVFVLNGGLKIRIEGYVEPYLLSAWEQPVSLPAGKAHEIEVTEEETFFITIHEEE